MTAFLSYQTKDKVVAGRLKTILEKLGIPSFLAHEDINVSEEWRLEILRKIGNAGLFVAVLSENYYKSEFCIQESGIAVFRENMTIIPLSIDGSLPMGFLSHIQSIKIDPENPQQNIFYPALAKRDVSSLIDMLIEIVAKSFSYRNAESNFKDILPYLQKASDNQIVQLLEKAASNNQVIGAQLCWQDYLPPLVKSHYFLLNLEAQDALAGIFKKS